MNMAVSDSLVASFLNKYHYNFWRPDTAIHAGDTYGNPKTEADPHYVPFIVTPCFPSNHGSAGNGAAEVLRRLYGEVGHSIMLTNPTLPNIVLQYASFKQIPTTSPTRALTAGYIFEVTKKPARASAGLSALRLQKQLEPRAR